MRLGVGVSCFDSEGEIKRTLDSIYKHVYRIYVVEGRYANFISDHDYSIDNTVKICKSYPNVVVESLMAYQPIKRTRYFELAGEDKCDFLMVMDADEYIHSDYQDWNLFYKNLDYLANKHKDYQLFKMYAFLNPAWTKAWNKVRHNTWKKYVRLHRNPGEMRYCLDHFHWCHRDATDKDIITGKKDIWNTRYAVDGIRFNMDSKGRRPIFLEGRDNWAWNTICEEQRRTYFASCDYYYGQSHPELNGFYEYDKQGRPVRKIADEDGTLVPEVVEEKFGKKPREFSRTQTIEVVQG